MTLLPTQPQRLSKPPEGLPALGITSESLREVETPCGVPDCRERAKDPHHIVRRSWLGGPRDWVCIDGNPYVNVVPLCRKHHDDVNGNVGGHKARIYFDDLDGAAPGEWRWHRKVGDHYEDEGPLSEPQASSNQPEPEELAYPKEIRAQAAPSLSEGQTETALSEGGEQVPSVSRTRTSLPPSESAEHDCEAVCTCGEKLVKRRRKPAEKKLDTKQLNFGYAPVDAVERLKVRIDDLVEAAGLEGKPFAKFKAVDLALVLASGVSAETLQEVVKELPWAA